MTRSCPRSTSRSCSACSTDVTPLVIAHRGASWDEPENTLPAFRRAIELGADYVEFDVHATRDGSLVVGHGRPRASHQYPALEEVLDVVNGRVGVMVERSASFARTCARCNTSASASRSDVPPALGRWVSRTNA
ncbi:MAG: glycerophosphodiester phosphodiesterase [Actinobacteria bacterium]|nr:MAG: glycerophosphodiester phosphodiesterase [Actinomycetota bacterium]